MVLRPLSHIAANWEASWQDIGECYEIEPNSFAQDLNVVIGLIATAQRPKDYHSHEDLLAEEVICSLKWPIYKKGKKWIGEDYALILEQGAFSDWNQEHLLFAATGRVHTALDFGQTCFDQMENRHRSILAALITIIIFHRYSSGTHLLTQEID
jgi:hypothetical protein